MLKSWPRPRSWLMTKISTVTKARSRLWWWPWLTADDIKVGTVAEIIVTVADTVDEIAAVNDVDEFSVEIENMGMTKIVTMTKVVSKIQSNISSKCVSIFLTRKFIFPFSCPE